MNPKLTIGDAIRIMVVTAIVGTYCYLVLVGKAPAEGFGVIVMYVVKKFFDGMEDGKPATQTPTGPAV